MPTKLYWNQRCRIHINRSRPDSQRAHLKLVFGTPSRTSHMNLPLRYRFLKRRNEDPQEKRGGKDTPDIASDSPPKPAFEHGHGANSWVLLRLTQWLARATGSQSIHEVEHNSTVWSNKVKGREKEAKRAPDQCNSQASSRFLVLIHLGIEFSYVG